MQETEKKLKDKEELRRILEDRGVHDEKVGNH
jgi:hypothetical protein